MLSCTRCPTESRASRPICTSTPIRLRSLPKHTPGRRSRHTRPVVSHHRAARVETDESVRAAARRLARFGAAGARPEVRAGRSGVQVPARPCRRTNSTSCSLVRFQRLSFELGPLTTPPHEPCCSPMASGRSDLVGRHPDEVSNLYACTRRIRRDDRFGAACRAADRSGEKQPDGHSGTEHHKPCF